MEVSMSAVAKGAAAATPDLACDCPSATIGGFKFTREMFRSAVCGWTVSRRVSH
jgi:hypothetical protein